jgi:hypothetical protein
LVRSRSDVKRAGLVFEILPHEGDMRRAKSIWVARVARVAKQARKHRAEECLDQSLL